MGNLSLISIIISGLVSASYGSGYLPSIGGPWSRYTTTQAPVSSGVNLPVTTAAPPPEVTFIPSPSGNRPELDGNFGNPGVNFGNGGGSFGNGNREANNILIIRDPSTGQEFSIPQDLFWTRFGDLLSGSQYMERQNNRINQYNRGSSAYSSMQNRRVRRMIESDEDRQIDQLQDENEDSPAPESYEFARKENQLQEDNIQSQTIPEDLSSSPNVLKSLFPDLKPNPQMIYIYTLSGPTSKRKEIQTTSTTTKPSTTTSEPTAVSEDPKVETTEIPDTTTLTVVPDYVEIKEPQPS